MTIISRLLLDNPTFGQAGGTTLYNQVSAMYQKLGDAMGSRFFSQTALANAAFVDFNHNFNTDLTNLRYDLYIIGMSGDLTQVTSTSSPALSDFSIVATPSFLKTKIRLTNNTGSAQDVALVVLQDPILLGELQNVDLVTTAPVAGDALTFDAVTSKWKPGQGSGSGAGGVNYVKNPSAKFNTANWSVTGGVTVTRDTTLAELPREFFSATGLKFAGGSAADYAYTRFSIDDVDLAKQLVLSFAQKPESGFAAGDWTIELYSADSGYTTFAQVSADTDDIQPSDYVVQKSMTSTTSPYYELRVVRQAGSKYLVLSDITFGPKEPTIVPAIGPWKTYVPVYSDAIVASQSVFYRTVGEMLEIEGVIAFNGTGSNQQFAYSLPTGFSVDGALYSLLGSAQQMGVSTFYRPGVGYGSYGATSNWDGLPGSPSNIVTLTHYNATDSNGSGLRGLLANEIVSGSFLGFSMRVKCLELNGNATVFGTNTSVEYAYNTDVSTSSTTGSGYAYGPQGVEFGPFTAGGGTVKEVRFRNKILPTDRLVLEVTDAAQDLWTPVEVSSYNARFQPYHIQGSTRYGMGLHINDEYTAYVVFGEYSFSLSTVNDSAGQLWSAISGTPTYKWRVVKCSNPLSLGHSLASETSAGLADPYNEGVGTIYAGAISPAAFATTNVNGVSQVYMKYQRIGKIVSGQIFATIDANTTATSTEVQFDLPVASNFGAAVDAHGFGVNLFDNLVGAITADSSTKRLKFNFTAGVTSGTDWFMNFAYTIIPF